MTHPTPQASTAAPVPAENASVPVDDTTRPKEDANPLTSSSSSTGDVSPHPGMSSHPRHDPPQTPATLPPVIDHGMFPHIMDMIIESAPPEALLQLSRTSKDMWARTARLVPTHIRITQADNDELSNATSNDNRVIVKRVMVKDGTPAVVATPPTRKLQPVDGWSFEATRILDFDGSIRGYFTSAALFSTFSAVHTLRFNSIPPLHLSDGESDIKTVVIRDYWRRDCSIRKFPRSTLSCPDGVEKVVCNIDYHATSNMANFYVGRFCLSETVREVVVIFTNMDNVTGASSSHTDSTARDNNAETLVLRAAGVKDDSVHARSDYLSTNIRFRPLGWLRRVLPFCPRVTKYTLVDAALVPPICFGIPGRALSPANLKIGIIYQMAMRFEVECDGLHSWDDTDWDFARKSIRVVTKSEYRHEIGEMDYLLETEW